MKKVLFVCSGNTLRSASAEYLFKKYLKDIGEDKYIVSSAGTHNNLKNIFKETIERVSFYGSDISRHKSTVINQEVVDNADIIICMSQHHQNFIKKNFNRKTYLFNELSIGQKTDLKDDGEAEGEYTDISKFIYFTIDTINRRLPNLYKKIILI